MHARRRSRNRRSDGGPSERWLEAEQKHRHDQARIRERNRQTEQRHRLSLAFVLALAGMFAAAALVLSGRSLVEMIAFLGALGALISATIGNGGVRS